MSPECLYWVALVVLVLPSAPFNRTAVVVLAVWAFGHLVYRFGPFDDAACMAARIIAIGAALALSRPWDGSRRAFAQVAVALLFVPAAILSGVMAAAYSEPAETMQEYHVQMALYWATWGVIMAQAILVPVGNDWCKVRATFKRADNWIMSRIVKHFGGAL